MKRHAIVLLFTGVLSANCQIFAPEAQLKASVALARNFETVVGSRGLRDSVAGKLSEAESVLGLPFSSFVSILDSAKKGLSDVVIGGSSAVLLGAKNFQQPRGIGITQFDFCYVAVLSPNRLGSIFNGRELVVGQTEKVWTWKAKLFEESSDPESVYASFKGPYLIIANTLPEIQLISNQLEFIKAVSDKEVAQLNRFDFWAYRRYPKKRIATERSGEFEESYFDIYSLEVFLDVKSLVFQLRTAVFAPRPKTIGLDRQLPRAQYVRGGIWRARISSSLDDENAVLQRLVLMSRLGFGFSP